MLVCTKYPMEFMIYETHKCYWYIIVTRKVEIYKIQLHFISFENDFNYIYICLNSFVLLINFSLMIEKFIKLVKNFSIQFNLLYLSTRSGTMIIRHPVRVDNIKLQLLTHNYQYNMNCWLLTAHYEIFQKYGVTTDIAQNKISAERCATLIGVAIANELDEVWIAKTPPLQLVYLHYCFPNFMKWYVLHNAFSSYTLNRPKIRLFFSCRILRPTLNNLWELFVILWKIIRIKIYIESIYLICKIRFC